MRTRYGPLVVLAAGVIACDAPPSPGECEDVLAPDAWVDGNAPRFAEMWRAGGTNEGEELAMPLFAAVGPAGQLAVTDFQLGTLGIASDGRWLGPLTQSGSGPGEIGTTIAAAWTDEGHLTVLDLIGGKIVFLDLANRVPVGLIGERRLDPAALAASMMSGQVAGVGLHPDGTTYFQTSAASPETREVTQTILRLPADGGPADTIATATTTSLGGDWRPAQNMVAAGFPRLVLAVAADGRVAVAGHGDAYEIRLLDPADEEATACRSVPGLPIRAYETGVGLDLDDAFLTALHDSPTSESPAPIGRLMFGREGRLWVERDRPSPANPLEFFFGRPGSLYDVFDPEGRYMGEVRAPEGARLVAASEDRVWAFEAGAFDVTSVVAYRLEPGD